MSEVDTQVEVQLMTEFNELKKQLLGLKAPLADFKQAVSGLSVSVKEVRALSQAFNELNGVNFTRTKEQIRDLGSVMGNVSVLVHTQREMLSQFETTMSRIGNSTKSVANGFIEFNRVLDFDLDEKLEKLKNLLSPVETLSLSNLNAKSLDGLVQGLTNLSKVDVSTLEKVDTDNISKLVDIMSSLGTKAVDTDSLQATLGFLEQLKLFDGNKIKNEFELLNTIDLGRFQQMVSEVNERVKPLNSKLTGLHSRIQKLNERLEKVSFKNFDFASERVGTIIPYIRTLNDDMGDLLKTKRNIARDSDRTARGIGNVGKSASKATSEIGALTKKLKGMFTLGNIYFLSNYLQSTFGRFGNALKNALDFTETENLFARSMNNMYSHAMKFQTKLGEMYGLAIPTMMKAQATYKNMIGNLGGLSEELSYKISEIVTKMTLDFSSLYNVDFEKASQKFQSALSKQVRPIRSISGFDITQNVLETTARDLGIERPLRKMNELEKRMLVILTLMQQMQNSRAMNDFSRTIEQPSNQLRILKEQLAEVGRWIGAVFYSTIAKVLPYINGFVMAVKEVIKAFALLIGYKIPDSSKETGTILDHMTDNMEDYNYAIDGVNGGLDETKDKLKEIEGSLAGFDKLNIIQSPKDSPTSGGGGGGGGLSGMTLDPAILNALEQYKYIFDDVSMKAHQIRDTLLEWKDIVVKTINDKIFAPLGLSWDRYGDSITTNLASALSNVKAIASDVVEILTDDWTEKFKVFADFGFSSLNVLSTALESLTSVLKGVWDRGGKALFEGCERLRIAVLRLATSINDNFITPLVRGLRNTVGVLVENVFGVFANNLALIINLIARMIEVVATSKGAVIALGSALTGMFLAIQISKLADFVSTLKQSNNIFDIFVPNVLTNTKAFQAFQGVLNNVSLSYKKYNDMLKNTGVYKAVTNAVENFANKHLQASGVLTGVFGKALTWLCANPLVALASGLAVGVGALALFGQKSEETSYKVEELSEEMQAQIKQAQELKQEIEETANKTPEVASDYLSQIEVVGEYITMLRSLSNEYGYVENVAKAKTLVDEINKVMPNTVKLTENNRLEWQKTPQEIEETTKALKEQAKQQAYMELYTEQLKNRMQAEKNLAEYRIQLTEKQIEREEVLAKIRSGNYSGDELAKLTSEGRELTKEINALKDTIGETEGAVKTATDSMETYSNCIDGTSDVLGDTTEQVNKLCNALALSDTQKSNILDGVNDVMTAYETMGKSTEENAKANKEHLDKMIANFQQLGIQYGISTNDMLTIMKTKGVQLTEEQKKQFVRVTEKQRAELLKQQKAFDSNKSSLLDILVNYNLNESTLTAKQSEEILTMLEQQGVNVSALKESQLKGYLKMLNTHNIEYNSVESKQYATLLAMLDKHGIDMESEQAQQYATSLRNAQAKGTESGQAYLNSIVNGFNKQQASTGGLPQAFSNVLNKVQEMARNTSLGINASIRVPSGTNSKIANSIGTVNIRGKLTIGSVVTNLASSVKESLGKLGINLYAKGGFPRTGQLFIANENGPELVGKMGSRSVVANNQQIVEGIASGVTQGVYEGMTRAMRNSGTFKPNITLVNNQVVDGKVVRKEVKKMQEENILMTGDPLFD